MINTAYNNNLISNINRKSIELVRDGNGAPFPFAENGKSAKFESIQGFPTRELEIEHFQKTEKYYFKEQGIVDSDKEKQELMNNNNIRKRYLSCPKKKGFFIFLKN
jgi:hypothetical protein